MPAPRSASVKQQQQQRARRLREIWQQKKGPLGLIQKDLAKRLGWQTQGAVGHVFSGSTPLTIDLLLAFCEILEVSPLEIVPELGDLMRFDSRYGAARDPDNRITDIDLNLLSRCIKALEEAMAASNVHLTEAKKSKLIEFLYAELVDVNRDAHKTLLLANRLVKVANLSA